MLNKFMASSWLACTLALTLALPIKGQEGSDLDFLASRIVSEVCLREFIKAQSDPSWSPKRESGWQLSDLKKELELVETSLESRQKAVNSPDEQLALSFVKSMVIRVATASFHLASNDLESARREIEIASTEFDERNRQLTVEQQNILKSELTKLGEAGNRIRLLDALRLILTKGRWERFKIAYLDMRFGIHKNLNLWKAECAIPKVQAQLECLLFDLDSYVANFPAVNTVDAAGTSPSDAKGEQSEVVRQNEQELRKDVPDRIREHSLDTIKIIAKVQSYFEQGKQLLREQNDHIKIVNIEGPRYDALHSLSLTRLDANRDGIVTAVELEKLHASFSRDYPIEFVQAVLNTLQALEKELESSQFVPTRRIIELGATNGFENGHTYRVKTSSNPALYFDFMNYARSLSQVTEDGRVTEKIRGMTANDFYIIYDKDEKESAYQQALEKTGLQPPQGT